MREAGRVKLADGIALYHQQLHQRRKKQNKTPKMTSTSHMGAKVGYEIKQFTVELWGQLHHQLRCGAGGRKERGSGPACGWSVRLQLLIVLWNKRIAVHGCKTVFKVMLHKYEVRFVFIKIY